MLQMAHVLYGAFLSINSKCAFVFLMVPEMPGKKEETMLKTNNLRGVVKYCNCQVLLVGGKVNWK